MWRIGNSKRPSSFEKQPLQRPGSPTMTDNQNSVPTALTNCKCPRATLVSSTPTLRLHRDECFMCKEKTRPLFKLPLNCERMTLWMKCLNQTEILHQLGHIYIYNNARLCHKHFDDKSFTSTLRTKLQPNVAVPTDLRAGTDAAEFEDVACTSEMEFSKEKRGSETQSIGRSNPVITPKTRQIRILRCSLSKLKKKLFKASELLDIPERPKLQDKLTASQYEFVLSQIRNGQNTPATGRRWSVKEKAFALDIFLQSSSTYKTLKKKLILPTEKTLRKCTVKVAKDDGFCPILFDALRKKVQQLPEEDKMCTLVFDEMSLKQQLAYNAALDRVDGYASEDKSKIASQALTFMLRGIKTNWKQAIAYYFRGTTSTEGWLKGIVEEIIRKVMSCGLSVIAIVCDQGPPNLSLFKSLGVTIEKPYFYVEEAKVFALYDMPHLIKSVRNNLSHYDCKFTNLKTNEVHTASWKDIKTFFDMDKDQKYRVAPKLTDAHMTAKGLGSMKVSLATQVFSHSVAAGLCYCYNMGLSSTALQTASFVNKIDKIFDSMNSKEFKSSKKYACAVSHDTDHLLKWKKWAKWISTWKFMNGKKIVRTHCKEGLILSLNAAVGIWETVGDKLKFLLTNRLNQDCIENMFSSIRRRGGFRNNPNPLEFRSAIRNVIVHNFMKKSKSKNCEDDDAVNLIELGNNVAPSLTSFYEDDDYEENELVIDESVEEEQIKFTDIEKNVAGYVSGVLTRSVLKKTSCNECKNLLVGPKLLQDHTFMLYFREYKDSHEGLKWPTDSYYDYIIRLSDAYFKNIDSIFNKPNIQKNLYKLLEKVSFDFFDHDDNRDCVQQSILKAYIKMMIRHTIKVKNGDCYAKNVRRLKHVMHI